MRKEKKSKKIQNLYDLSPMQQGMLFHYLLDKESHAYKEQSVFSLEGEINSALLEKSFNILIERYDIFRTAFVYEKLDEPVQVVLKKRTYKMPVEDISHLPEEEKQKYLDDFKSKDLKKGFDLSKDLLMRIYLLKTGINSYKLVWTLHHILMDGWCMGIVFKEWSRIYEDLSNGNKTPLQLEPVTQYKNYIKWLQQQDKPGGLKYWREYLEEYEQQTSLPKFVNPAKTVGNSQYRSETHRLLFNEPIPDQLTGTARVKRVTLNILFQAMWGVLLQKYNNTDDVVFGAVVSGRPPELEGIENMIGLFINTVPVRIKAARHWEFSQLINHVRESAAASKSYEYLPLAEIQANSQLKDHLIDHILVFENYPVQEEIKKIGLDQGPRFRVKEIENYEQTNYDLNIIIIPGKRFTVKFTYNGRVYDKDSIARVSLHFEQVVRQVMANPGIQIKEIEILTPEEKRQLLEDFNQTKAKYPIDKTIHELLETQVKRKPGKIAVIDRDQYLTYQELNERANQLARLLRKKRVKPDSIAGIIMEPCPELVIGIIGILKAGGAFLPIDHQYPEKRILSILQDSDISILLTREKALDDTLKESKNQWLMGKEKRDIILLDDITGKPDRYSRENLTNMNQPGDLLYLISTSGSTGTPKNLMLEHRNMINLLHFQFFETIVEFRRVLQFASIGFDVSSQEVFSALLRGGELYLIDENTKQDVLQLFELIRRNHLDVVFWPPAFLKFVFSQPEYRSIFPDCIRHIITAGEQLIVSEPTRNYLQENRVYLHNHYGPAETHVVTTLTINPSGEIPLIPSIGKPISNTRIYILDENRRLKPIGTVGELYIAGANVGRGYLDRPELTNEKFERDVISHSSLVIRSSSNLSPNDQCPMTNDRFYRTGDLARWLPDGNIEFIGRADLQVKIRGFRIELGEIETRLLQIDFINEAVVLELKNPEAENFLCAYIASEKEIEISELKNILSDHLPGYMIPGYFMRLERIPVTSNGKVDKKALPFPEMKKGTRYIAPRNKVEKELARIWSEVLGIEKDKISIESDFFELGGHSLKATILITRIHKAFNVKVTMAEMFKQPTISGLAEYLKTAGDDIFTTVEPVEKREYYPLSSAQKRIYILQQMKIGNTGYNNPDMVILEGDLSKEKLEKAVKKMINRHETLRTSFEMIAEQPVQKINDYHRVVFGVKYNEMSEEDANARVQEFTTPFDLTQPPLLRVEMIQVGKKYILMYDMHHIITDGTSMQVFLTEFMVLYGEKELPPLRIQYKDFSAWQKDIFERGEIKKQQMYWLKQFDTHGEVPGLNLPTDYPRPDIQCFEGSAAGFRVGSEETHALKQLAKGENATLYMVLLSVFNVLLSKISGQEDIIVGTPIAGRRHADLHHIIGMFVNTLAMRNFPAGGKTFREFLAQVKKSTLDAFENQDYPFEELVEQIIVNRDTSRNPLFDVMFTLQNMEVAPGSTTGTSPLETPLKLLPQKIESTISTSKFDIILRAAEPGDFLFFSLNYSTKLFKPGTIARFIGYFNQVVSAILESTDKKISEIEIMSIEEKKQLLVDFNDTKVDYLKDMTIHEWFEEQVNLTPDHIALLGTPEGTGGLAPLPVLMSLTYSELNEKSNQLAYLLREKGAAPDIIVGIMVERSVEMIIGIISILKTGSAYIPIDPDSPPERIKYMLKDSSAKIIVTGPGLSEKFEKLSIVICHLSMNKEAPTAAVFSNPQPAARRPQLAYVIYTSGTTGKPKGVLLENKNLANYNRWFGHTINITGEDRSLLTSSFAFDLGYTSLFPPLLSGGQLHLIPRETYLSGESLIHYMSEKQITYIKVTPSLFKLIVRAPDFPISREDLNRKLKALRLVVLGGEPIDLNDVEIFHRSCRHTRLMNHYGPTEATIGCIAKLIDFNCFDSYKTNPTIGKPIGNIRVYIIDRYFHLLPPGIVGELCLSGKGVARGYLNKPGLTAEKFVEQVTGAGDWCSCINKKFLWGSGGRFLQKEPPGRRRQKIYRTGDLARWLADGNIEFSGRIDLQVKIRGFRIELEEIESRLLSFDFIKQAVVIDKEMENSDKYLCAYIVAGSRTQSAEGADIDIAELREYLSALLPDYMIPNYFVTIDRIPVTPGGKVDRKALPEPGLTAINKYVAPGNDIEKKLVEIWSDVLHVNKEKISINANFFELGGHSLTATILISKIHKELMVKIPLANVLKSPTIRGLSGYVGTAKKKKYQEIVPVEVGEYHALSSAQKRLYFLQQLDLTSTSYNMPMVLPLFNTGTEIEKNRIESTLKKLIARHESLRTSFVKVNEIPMQKIHEPGTVDFAVDYYEADEMKAGEIVVNFIRPFDLGQAPLIRSGIIKLPDSHYTWMVDMHHIISDGTSRIILREDFRSLNNGEELGPLRLQFKDFSQWQNQLFESGEIKGQEDYWLSLYADAGEIPRLNLPLDFRRPEVFRFVGDYYGFRLERGEASRFRELGVRNGATLYMNMLAVLNTLFYKYTSQTDIIIGCGIAGRPHADLQRIVGMFVNSLAMRNYPRGQQTYESFLKEVAANSINAFENQDVQFEELVDQLDLERDPSRNPVFDILMVVQNFRRVGEGIGIHKNEGPLQVEGVPLVDKDSNFPVIEYRNPTSKFDMTFFIHEVGEDVHIFVEYYTAIFKLETIQSLTRHLKKLINQVVVNPNTKLDHLDIVPEEEKRQLLEQFNNTRTPYPAEKTIGQLFARQVKKTPLHTALVMGEETLTYKTLDQQSDQIAHYLYEQNHINWDQLIGILMDRSLAVIAVIIGILKAGGAYVPLSPQFPETRLKTMATDSNINVLIGQKKYIKTLNRLQWECKNLEVLLCIDSEDVFGEDESEANELMNRKLWEYVGETSVDEVTGGGWNSSYTGEPIPKQEMDEYGDNILKKLQPLFHKDMRVLEIGAASGISMYRIAPHVSFYYGTDLSRVIIEKNRQRIKKQGHANITVSPIAAHEIDSLEEKDFDLVIMNSVIQCFNGHNYLRKIIAKTLTLMKPKGYIFIGDIMDQDLKEDLVAELVRFKEKHRGKNYKTKIDWSQELFISRAFLEDLCQDFPAIKNIEFSTKIYTLENELTKFRYDALIHIDKEWVETNRPTVKPGANRHKYQHDMRQLRKHGTGTKKTKKIKPLLKSGNLAYIMYTSGSTGIPKGTMVTHRNVVRLVKNNYYVELRAGDRILQTGVLEFDASTFEIWGALLNGLELHLADKNTLLTPEALKGLIRQNRITTIWMTAALYNRMVEEDTDIFASLRNLLVGGEVLSPPHINRLRKRFPGVNIINGYGPTENTTFSTTYCIDKEYESNIPIGRPIANSFAYIVDKGNRLVPIGIRGELWLGGDGVSRGYLNDPELTGEKFLIPDPRFQTRHLSKKKAGAKSKITNYKQNGTHAPMQSCNHAFMQSSLHHTPLPHYPIYRTGDLARWLWDGNIEFLGRIDQQVKIRGFRIELGEIENQLLKIKDIKEAVVIDREEENSLKYLCAYIVQTNEFDPLHLKDFLSKSLPDYMIPTSFIHIGKIPVTPSGKVDRKALPSPGMRATANDEHVAPRNEIEKKLAAQWSEVLNVDKEFISIDSNFFDLGGHSLKATTLISRIHKELEVKIPLVELFKRQTIREMAEYIKDTGKEKYASIEAVEEKEYYVLSSAQKRLYLLYRMTPDSTAYNLPMSIPLGSGIDREKIESVLKQLILRHESLRTSFEIIDEEPVQRVHHNVELASDYVEGDEKSAEEIVKNFTRPFDLSKVPLLRSVIIKLPAGNYNWFIDMHHIITDGTSHQVLTNEFMSLYSGEEPEPLILRYRDYSEWQNSGEQQTVIKNQEDYWLKTFAGELPILDLPTDYPRPLLQNFAGGVVSFMLEKKETKFLQEIAGKTDSTLYMVLLSAYNVLLARLSGKEDIVVGTPIAARRHADLQNIIGMFVNTLTMRNYPSAEKRFANFFNEVKQNTIAAYENQEYQFEELVDKLNVPRDTSRNPVFDVLFNLLNQAEYKGVAPKLENDKNYIHRKTQSKFDLELSAIQWGENLYFNLTYCSKLFKPDSIDRIIRGFKNILSIVSKDINIKLNQIDLLTREEKERILSTANGVKEPVNTSMTIHRWFEEKVRQIPQNTAAVFEDKQLTYKELDKKSNQLAFILRKKGVKPDRIVALMLERSLEMIIALLAILKAGGAYLPIDTRTPLERMKYIIKDSGVSIILTRDNVMDKALMTSLKNVNVNGTRPIKPLMTPPRKQVSNFDSLPLPDRSLVDYSRYHQYISSAMAKHTVSVQTTRGCPYRCIYCNKICHEKYVLRSAGNIFEEIRRCYHSGVRRFAFVDDVFNLNEKNASDLFNQIIHSGLEVQLFFSNGLRGDILSKEFIDLMIKAGTATICLALESASARIQKLIKKNLNLIKFKENIQYIINKYPQVILELELMHGFPTETKEEAMETLDFLLDLKWVHFPDLHILKIYQNTDMYRLAVAHGIAEEKIARSSNLAYHQIPDTLPFSKDFTRQYQAKFLNEYFFLKERLLTVLPYQMKILSEDELVQKYDSYLPMKLGSFQDILACLGISPEELRGISPADETGKQAPLFSEKMVKYFPKKKKKDNAFKVLLIDLSLLFSAESKDMLYDVVEAPLGLMYLMTYLNEQLEENISGKVVKSRIDFDNYEELKTMIFEFNPDLIGIRTLSIYREFFHYAVSLIRHWRFKNPIIAGGPYATSDYIQMLQDGNIDLAVIGEGEITFLAIINQMIENGKTLPTEEILKDIPGIAFITDKDKKTLRETSCEVIFIDETEISHQPHHNLEHVNTANHLVYLIYTSGSTGKPKGVMLEHLNVVNLMKYNQRYTNMDLSKVLQFHTIGFDASFNEIFCALLSGGRLYLIEDEIRTNIAELLKRVEKNKIMTLFLPMSFLKIIFNEEENIQLMPGCVKHIQTAGEQVVISDRFKNFLRANHVFLHNHYGPSETHVVTALTIAPTGEIPARPSIGLPILNTYIYILDKWKHLLPIGITGELFIGGIQVGRGYLNNPELTNQKFQRGWHPRPIKNSWQLYKTGDLARWLSDGNIEFLGRIDSQVKIRGFRVEPGEIERHLLNHAAIKEAVVQAGEDQTGDKYLCAYITAAKELARPELQEYLSRYLPDYMIPSYFVFIEKIPLTPSGKIEHRALPAPGVKTAGEYIAPQNEIEEKLAELWAEVLNVEKGVIGIDSNFFQLGGHSLKATILAAKIHKKFNVQIPLVELFNSSTIRELAQYIHQAVPNQFVSIEPIEKKEYYHISHAQKRLWILARIEKEQIAYNIPGSYKFEKFNREAFEKAIQTLIKRHEILRTTFITINGDPMHQVQDIESFEFKVDYIDLRKEENPERQQQQIKRIADKEVDTPFDLEKGSLRAKLVHQQDQQYVFLYTMHHIISDGWSMNVLINEIMLLYHAYCQNKDNPLLPLRIQYKDFSAWHNRQLTSQELETHRRYWMQKFRAEIPILKLETDFPRPQIKTSNGSHVHLELPEETLAELKKFCREHDVSLLMLLVAALKTLFYRYTGQQDIVIGLPVAGRDHIELENQIGFYINTLPLRTNFAWNDTFTTLLTRIKDTILGALRHQVYPLDRLVEDLELERDLSRSPLFDVVVQLLNFEGIGAPARQNQNKKKNHKTLIEVGTNGYNTTKKICKFDLTFNFMESEEIGLIGLLIYNRDLFREEGMLILLEKFKLLLQGILSNPKHCLDDFDIELEFEKNMMKSSDSLEFNFEAK